MPEEHVRIMCPNLVCRKVLSVPQETRGRTVRCRACGTMIRVPQPASAAGAAAPAPTAEAPGAKPGKAKSKPDAA